MKAYISNQRPIKPVNLQPYFTESKPRGLPPVTARHTVSHLQIRQPVIFDTFDKSNLF